MSHMPTIRSRKSAGNPQTRTGGRLPFWLWLLLPCAALLAAAAAWFWRDQPDLARNPYVFYERNITARIGAYAPYAFMDKGGTLDGYVMDLTYAISRVMGARVVLLSRRLDNPAELARRHDADVVLCMVKTPASSQDYTFTEPYASHSFSIFGPPGAAVPGRNEFARSADWVLNTDGVYYELYGRQITCALTSSAEEALHEIARGAKRYTIMETYVGNKLIEEQALNNVTPLAETDISVEYAFAVRRGNDAAYDIFSRGLAYLRTSGQFEKIQNKWLEKRFLLTERRLESLLLYGASGLLVAAFAGLLAFLWLHTLRAQVRTRTAALEQEISERRKAERRLLESQAQLLEADKMAAVGTLASGIAHEINNPNGLLLLNLDFLRHMLRDLRPRLDAISAAEGDFRLGGIPWSRLRHQCGAILDDSLAAAGHIRDIVNDLKEFVRKDEETGTTRFDLNDVLEHSLRFVKTLLKKSTAHCRMECARDLPPVSGSPRKIGQVMVNLIINACQALENREQGLLLETGLSPEGNEVFFRCTDEGRGIAQEDLSRLCEPFFTTKRAEGGTGLGLSISATIAESHGGRLAFASSPGKGTAATLFLPVARAASPLTESPHA